MTSAVEKVTQLSIWRGKVEPRVLKGGITNTNFLVEDAGQKFFVRVGADIPIHGVLRFNELAALRAAEAAGISPGIVHVGPGVLVTRFVEGKTFGEADVREEKNLKRIVPLLRRVHLEMPRFLRGPILAFWVFHVVRDYAGSLKDGGHRLVGDLPRLLEIAEQLERAVGRIELVFGHNDLLPANFIDEGERLWLVDWDYAGFNSPLFDLGGLASNNELSAEQEAWLLEAYYGAQPDGDLWRRYRAMKCASLLREAMWSMVSELHSTLDIDFVAYTAVNLGRFEAAWAAFQEKA